MMQLKFGLFLLLKTEAQLSGDVLKKPVLKNLMIFIEKYLQWCLLYSVELWSWSCILTKTLHWSEVYLEPSETSTMKLFCKNSEWVLAVNYYRKKAPLWMFGWVLNTPLLFYHKEDDWLIKIILILLLTSKQVCLCKIRSKFVQIKN